MIFSPPRSNSIVLEAPRTTLPDPHLLMSRLQFLEGSSEEAEAHMRGLQRLIALRGGDGIHPSLSGRPICQLVSKPHTLSLDCLVGGKFLGCLTGIRVDLELAASLRRRPRFPLHYDIDRVRLPRYVMEDVDTTAVSCLEGLGSGSETLQTAIRLLRQRVAALRCKMDPLLRDVRTLSQTALYLYAAAQ